MKKKCRVVMLPTNQKAKSIAVTNHGLSYDESDYLAESWNHLYIVSDDQIQVGNTVIKFISDDMSICPVQDEQDLLYISAENELGTHITCGKIIASTDYTLNLPSLSQSFIQKYCEVGGIEEVMVEFVQKDELGECAGIWTPKVNKNNEIISRVKDYWNKEEVIKLINRFHNDFYNTTLDTNSRDRWIEKNL